jgi:hypothetical protein
MLYYRFEILLIFFLLRLEAGMAYDPNRGPNIKKDDDELRKAQQRAEEERKLKERIAQEALKRTVKKP